MAISDEHLIPLLKSDDAAIRGAALELLSSSFATDRAILENIFSAWDTFGIEQAFNDFPLISHLSIDVDQVDECIERAARMVEGRGLTDRTCRCAGRLIESISVGPPIAFEKHLDAIALLKQSSKIFFRVPLPSMRERAGAIHRETMELRDEVSQWSSSIAAVAMEALYLRGAGDDFIGDSLTAAAKSAERSSRTDGMLELAMRHTLHGFEQQLVDLIDHEESVVSDAATIALARCRNQTAQSLIANQFPKLSRMGQLRSIDVLRRNRIGKSSMLLRFLQPHSVDRSVEEALHVAAILQFDFSALEDWLESVLVASDVSISRLKNLFAIVPTLAQQLVPDEAERVIQLVESRLK